MIEAHSVDSDCVGQQWDYIIICIYVIDVMLIPYCNKSKLQCCREVGEVFFDLSILLRVLSTRVHILRSSWLSAASNEGFGYIPWLVHRVLGCLSSREAHSKTDNFQYPVTSVKQKQWKLKLS